MRERRGWLAREVAAWGRAIRGVAVGLAVAAVALAVLRFAGGRGLLVVAVLAGLLWGLARIGGGPRPR